MKSRMSRQREEEDWEEEKEGQEEEDAVKRRKSKRQRKKREEQERRTGKLHLSLFSSFHSCFGGQTELSLRNFFLSPTTFYPARLN